jgi:predicted RNA-binding Zn-ribbon protein involved in translation (DUF1610 family)
MSNAIPQIVEPCPSCGQPVDVTDQEPFSEVACPACGATMRARVQFNNYTIVELLGEGGMGAVYKAVDRNLQRMVALKVLKRDAGSTESDWEKLAVEARLTAAVNHQNVVKVFSFGEDHGRFYLAMELVEKGSLDGLMILQTRVAEAQVLDIGIQVAEGLQAAFEHGLIHRDIKPGNILFAGPKLAKIVDFGLARVLDEEAQEAGEIWGTPFYVAPEKLDGRPEDFRSDIYSLGGTLFHALSGRPPFDAKTASMVVLKHIKSQAVSLQAFAPNISDETAYVINRMLNKEPDGRYSSYDELLVHLRYARQQLQKRQSGPQQPRLIAIRRRKGRDHRHLFRVIWGVAGGLCALIAIWFFLARPYLAERPTGAEETARTNALMMAGWQALDAKHFDDARAKLADAVKSAGQNQPARNWALAQLGLADLLAGDSDAARSVFADLGRNGMFSYDLTRQPLGHFFVRMGNAMASSDGTRTEAWSNADYEAFALLTIGISRWTAGDVDTGGRMLQSFAESQPQPPDVWISDLKPVAAPYVADYRTYIALRDEASKATGTSIADLLVRIESAKAKAKTGAPMVNALDALGQQLKL